MKLDTARNLLAGVGLISLLWAGTHLVQSAVAAQEGAPRRGQPAPKKEPRQPAKDYNQRSLEIYEYRKAAKNGPDRGEEIYYYKCWYCHNEYTKGIPKLDGLYSHPKLVSGLPVNDDTVRDKILHGGPGMPAYKYTLTDADMADLIAYLREKCCWNSEAPPANPRYRAR